jgi:YD repeat-containing protein
VVSYRRGVLGEREALVYPGGKTVRYEYDTLRRLISMESDEGRYGFAYDENGRLSKRSLPNGIFTEYAYDLSGKLSMLESRDREGVLDRFTYLYDPNGNTTLVGK